mgnify:CR=1 FL=1|jgi:hypothetical protein
MLESQWKVNIEQILVKVVSKFDLESKQEYQLKRRHVFRDTHNKIFRSYPLPTTINLSLLLRDLEGYGCAVETSEGRISLTFHQNRYKLSPETKNYKFLIKFIFAISVILLLAYAFIFKIPSIFHSSPGFESSNF